MTCRPDCACQCNQQGCGCRERPTVYVPNRPTITATQPEEARR